MTRMQPWFPAFRLLSDESRIAARYASKPVRCDCHPLSAAQPHGWLPKASPIPHCSPRSAVSRPNSSRTTAEEDEECDKPLVFALAGTELREEKSGRTFRVAPTQRRSPSKSVRPPCGSRPRRASRLRTCCLRPVSGRQRRGAGPGGQRARAAALRGQAASRLCSSCRPAACSGSRDAACTGGPRCDPSTPRRDFVRNRAQRSNNTRAWRSIRTARITVDHPVAAARLVLRHHPAPSELMLDGKPVRADRSCDALRPGLNELYRQTEPFRLGAEHELVLKAGGGDTNYFLPVAWVVGDFAIENGAIRTLPRTVGAGPLWKQGLADFTGRVTYDAGGDPAACGQDQAACQHGRPLHVSHAGRAGSGRTRWAPFEWTIPAGLRGKKAELKITVSTSVAPMFGDWKNPEGLGTRSSGCRRRKLVLASACWTFPNGRRIE